MFIILDKKEIGRGIDGWKFRWIRKNWQTSNCTISVALMQEGWLQFVFSCITLELISTIVAHIYKHALDYLKLQTFFLTKKKSVYQIKKIKIGRLEVEVDRRKFWWFARSDEHLSCRTRLLKNYNGCWFSKKNNVRHLQIKQRHRLPILVKKNRVMGEEYSRNVWEWKFW